MRKLFYILCTLALVITSVPITTYAAGTHVVTFDFDHPDFEDKKLTVGHAQFVSKPIKPNTTDNPDFKYWSLNGVEYNFDAPVLDDITLLAKWERYVVSPVYSEFDDKYGLVGASDPTYSSIFSTDAAAAFLQCQPLDALNLCEMSTGITPIIPDDLSELSATGAVDLPRLKSGYYYSLAGDAVETYGFKIQPTLYPVLTWERDVPADTEVVLEIRYEAEENIFFNTKLHFNTTMAGAAFVDPSSSLVDKALKVQDTVVTMSGDVYGYPASLHKSSIITQNSITFLCDPLGSSSYPSFNEDTNDERTKSVGFTHVRTFAGYLFESDSGESTITQNYDTYLHSRFGTDITNSALIVGTPLAYTTYDNNRNDVVSVIPANSTKPVAYNDQVYAAYIVATEGGIELHKILNNELTRESLTSTPGNSQLTVEVNSTEYTSMLSSLDILSAQFLVEFVLSEATDLDIDPAVVDDIRVRYIGTEDKTYNAYLSSLGGFGYVPGYAVVKLKAAAKVGTVNYWGPDAVDKTTNVLLNTEKVDLTKPSFTYAMDYNDPLYQTSPWYSSAEHISEVNLNDWAATAKHEDVLDVYCYPVYIGGSYKVQFYDDSTESSSEAVFETRTQPTLPEVASRAGYLFKNWCIVDTTASTSGTPYSRDTFKPQKDNTYIFKTFWDIEGIITEVKTTKTEYYTGDSVDKSKIIVKVQTDNNGTTKTLKTNEFTISPAIIEKDGTNQILVTYNATGATGTFTVTGKPVEPTKISAKYKGDDLKVGSTLSASDFEVTVHYNNGDKETTKMFEISPTTVRTAGSNTIKVTYGNLSTTCIVKGIKATTESVIKEKTLQYISATYTGVSPYVGDTLNKSNFTVNAHYSDGSKSIVTSANFTISPMTISREGYNVITISYSGKSCTMSISARAKSNTSDGSGSSFGSGNSSGSGSGNVSGGTSSNSGSNSNSNSNSGNTSSNSNSNTDKKGDPTTGAGMPASDKGTSTSYLHGSNILNSYAGNTTGASVENNIDIVKEIKAAGTSTSKVAVTLYNGALNNYITPEALKLLKAKGILLEVTMIDPENQTDVVGIWDISGKALDDTSVTINPNIKFESKDKGSEIVSFISVNEMVYPSGINVKVRPKVTDYDIGELVNMYYVNSSGSDSKYMTSFKWDDDLSPIDLYVHESYYYALSNSPSRYTDGTSLMDKIVTNANDVIPSETSTEDSFEWEEDTVESDEFNWDDDSETSDPFLDEPVPEKKPVPIGLIIGIAAAIVLLGGGAAVAVVLKKNSDKQKMSLFDSDVADDEDDYDYDEDDSPLLDTEDSDDML